jgi:predicted Zn-dependent protease
MLPSVRENAPGWTALGATLRARGELDAAADAASRLIEEDEDDPHGWRVMALVASDRGETLRSGDAWERSARLGLDVPGALAGLEVLRRDSLARSDSLGAADVESRIARIRRG